LLVLVLLVVDTNIAINSLETIRVIMNLCSDVMCTSGNFWMVNLGHWSVSSVSIDSQGMLFPNVLSPEERKPCDNGQMLHYTYSQLDIVW